MTALEGATRLDRFEALLLDWNPRINLVAAGDLPQLRRRHIEDSLQLLPLLPTSGVLADLGSGGGFPGLILAAADPGRHWHLVESDRRKTAFLAEAVRLLALPNVTIHARRIEEVTLPPLAALTARALAPLDVLLAHAARLLGPGGIAIFPKGKNAEVELTAARRNWTLQAERIASATDPAATIFRMTEIARVGA